MYDIYIVGCGLAGMVTARALADRGLKVKIFERRSHIGGNIYDEYDKDGFLIQKYGPHCFFTNNASVKTYIERFVETRPCFVHCKTVINGMKLPMPFNFTAIKMIYGNDKGELIIEKLRQVFPDKDTVYVTDLINCENGLVREFGNYIYEHEYKLYTAKQWGLPIENISPEIYKRVPVYLSDLDIYENHKYQFLPKGGFTHLAEQIINSTNITVQLNCNVFREQLISISEDKVRCSEEPEKICPVIYTGELDELFDYKYGKLPYRSLEFIYKLYNRDEYQDCETMAYPEADKITRITEYKKLPPQDIAGKTKISIEIPFSYDKGQPVGNEPYYPIKNQKNDEIYQKYLHESKTISNLYLCGRLAEYKYYNMDAVIIKALEVANFVYENNFNSGANL